MRRANTSWSAGLVASLSKGVLSVGALLITSGCGNPGGSETSTSAPLSSSGQSPSVSASLSAGGAVTTAPAATSAALSASASSPQTATAPLSSVAASTAVNPTASTEPSVASSASMSAVSAPSSAVPSASASGSSDMGIPSASADSGAEPRPRPARVLLYSFSTLNIPSVPAQLTILTQQLEGWGFEVDTSQDPAKFTDESLAGYAAVGMINTCFSPFGANSNGQTEAEALQRFLQAGGGLFGTHCADVTFQSASPPALYNQLLGGRASSQNFEGLNHCRKAEEHATTAELPAEFDYTGNLDGTNFIADDSVVLVNCTWGNGTEVAVSWVRTEGEGRVFFTNFGKVDSDLTNPTIGAAHILAGLEWVLWR